MIVSVASGKGGTGKTTVAVNLALFLSQETSSCVQFADCDVEEPNAHLFLKPTIERSEGVHIPVPEINLDRCNYCGRCAEVCAYNAIAVVKDEVLVFRELCHGCGGCVLLCPEKAIGERNREIGVIEEGKSDSVGFVHGYLNVGEPMATPLIRTIRKRLKSSFVNVVDVPPGTSCPMIEAVKESDFTILVTEPTPFGLNDLILAVEVVRKLGIPHGVVINQADIGDDRVKKYCQTETIPVIGEIPYERNIAVLYSHGIPMWIEGEKYRRVFRKMWASMYPILD
jgi:MinD superfamily P-loop ATPase